MLSSLPMTKSENLNKSSAFCISNLLMKPPPQPPTPLPPPPSEAEHNLKSYFKTTITSNFKQDEIASVLEKEEVVGG